MPLIKFTVRNKKQDCTRLALPSHHQSVFVCLVVCLCVWLCTQRSGTGWYRPPHSLISHLVCHCSVSTAAIIHQHHAHHLHTGRRHSPAETGLERHGRRMEKTGRRRCANERRSSCSVPSLPRGTRHSHHSSHQSLTTNSTFSQ